MSKLVKLWKRKTYDGKSYRYYLIYYDVEGRRRQKALGHADKRKAERQCAQLERELRMGSVEPGSMRLSEFWKDCLARTRGQVRGSTLAEYNTAMNHFIEAIGNIDIQKIRHVHGERFVQLRLDCGDAPATARKKLKTLNRMVQLAVDRGQLDDHPLRRVRQPKVPRKQVSVYSDEECHQLILVMREMRDRYAVNWELLTHTALCTGMRRGEMLNTTWRDVDFSGQKIHVSPKRDTKYTWEWHIKDTDRRSLPLTDELVKLLAEHQAGLPDGYPYVFVPPVRFDRIQERRRQGTWTVEDGRCPLNNFSLQFNKIREKAGIEDGTFHDLRRTCLSRWLANGLSEYEVMKLAGHASFDTTHTFYLSVREDLLDRARVISESNSVANLLQVPSEPKNEKSRQTQVLDGKGFIEHARQDSNL
jgi:integrase